MERPTSGRALVSSYAFSTIGANVAIACRRVGRRARSERAPAVMRLERYDDVTRVRLTSAGSTAAGMSVSAYVVRGVMIDTGFPHAGRVIGRLVDELRPRAAIVTHWHEDHAGNVHQLAARRVPVALPALTEALLRQRPPIRLYRRVVWGRSPRLRDPIVPFADPSLALVATPGHSDDHHVVWDAEQRTLFSGDLWLGVRSRVMHPSENPYAIVRSLRATAALRPVRMFDAHRGFVADAAGALTARADWMDDAIAATRQRIAAGWSDRAIARALLGGEELTAVFSAGEYARTNFVRAVRRGDIAPPGAAPLR